MEKRQARKILKEIRANVTYRTEKEDRICAAALSLARDFSKIFVYVSMGTEVSTRGIITALLEEKEIYVPYTLADNSMHAVRPRLPMDFVVCGMGNVKSDNNIYYDGQADLIITPLLGFDSNCNRLGYGAGCYDRYFEKYPNGIKAGLAFSEQQCEISLESSDFPLDMIITPDGIIRRNNG